MSDALVSLARNEVYQPLRMVVRPPGANGAMGLMPSHRAGRQPAYGVKVVCIFPENPKKGLDAHQGSVMLLSGETGELLALMNASAITAIRTAAVSAVATQILARADASELAIIGAGVQARTHIEAMACARQIKRARVASRSFENAKRFAEEMRPRYELSDRACRNRRASCQPSRFDSANYDGGRANRKARMDSAGRAPERSRF